MQALERGDAGDVARIEIERAHDVVLGVGAAAALEEQQRAIQQRARAIGRRGRDGGARRVQAQRGVAAREGGQLGRIVQRSERAPALGEHLAVEAQRLVGLPEARAAQLGEAPQELGARLARARARHLPRRGPRQQLGAALPVADRQQQTLGRRARRRVVGIEIEHGEPGRRALGGIHARALREGGDVAQQAQLLLHVGDEGDGRDGEAQRLGRASRALEATSRRAHERHIGRELGERHEPDVERALELSRGVQQRRALGERAQAIVAHERRRVGLERRRELAAPPDLAQQPRALGAQAAASSPGGAPRSACSSTATAPTGSSSRASVSARRSPRRRRRAGSNSAACAARRSSSRRRGSSSLGATRSRRLVGERERRLGAGVARDGALERRQHGLERLPRAEPRQQALRVQIVPRGRRGVRRQRRRRHGRRGQARVGAPRARERREPCLRGLVGQRAASAAPAARPRGALDEGAPHAQRFLQVAALAQRRLERGRTRRERLRAPRARRSPARCAAPLRPACARGSRAPPSPRRARDRAAHRRSAASPGRAHPGSSRFWPRRRRSRRRPFPRRETGAGRRWCQRRACAIRGASPRPSRDRAPAAASRPTARARARRRRRARVRPPRATRWRARRAPSAAATGTARASARRR